MWISFSNVAAVIGFGIKHGNRSLRDYAAVGEEMRSPVFRRGSHDKRGHRCHVRAGGVGARSNDPSTGSVGSGGVDESREQRIDTSPDALNRSPRESEST